MLINGNHNVSVLLVLIKLFLSVTYLCSLIFVFFGFSIRVALTKLPAALESMKASIVAIEVRKCSCNQIAGQGEEG